MNPSGDFLEERRQAVHAEMKSVIYAGKLANDPAALVLEAMGLVVDFVYDIMKRMETTATKPPLSDVQIRDISQATARVVDRRVAALVRLHLASYVGLALAVLVCVALMAGVGAYSLAGGFRSETCAAREGGVVCSHWTQAPTRATVR